MIQGLAQRWAFLGKRRASALLLAICLNLALVPCAIALEAIEQGHDCCPSEIQIESSDCCELDDVNVDVRSGTLSPDESPDTDSLPAHADYGNQHAAYKRSAPSVDPPARPGETPPLYKLHCAYLK